MRVAARAVIEIPATPDRVFDVFADYGNFPHLFRRWGPIPGVVHCDAMADDDDGRARRKLTLTDGSVYEETILASERPHAYRYRWQIPPTMPLKLLVRTAEAHWEFQAVESGDRTRVVWNYYFELTAPFMYPFAVVLRAMFNRWMIEALDRLRQASVDATRVIVR